MVERKSGKVPTRWGPVSRSQVPEEGLQIEKITPEKRTEAFFRQKALDLAKQLKPENDPGIVIVNPETDRRIRIVKVQPFPQVGHYYHDIEGMETGTFWNPPKRVIAQSLIVTQHEGGLGACVRILQAEFYDPKNNDYVKELKIDGEKFNQREGAIARYLGLHKGAVSSLKFLDDSETLYVVPGKKSIPKESEELIESEDADRMIRELLEEE